MRIGEKLVCPDYEGIPVYVYSIQGSGSKSALVTNAGATVLSLVTEDKNGCARDVLLGNDDALAGLKPGPMFGATLGRCSGRLETGEVEISGQKYQLTKNNGDNHSHGGKRGFDKRVWQRDCASEDKLVLTYKSPDGEEGYPGNLELRAEFYFENEDTFSIEYFAVSDKDTLVSISNHMYFNLNGIDAKDILDHRIYIGADKVSIINKDAVPTGEHLAVEGTPFDFREEKLLSRDILSDHALLRQIGTYDHNFILNDCGDAPVFSAYTPDSGIKLEIRTSMPAAHFYAADFSNTGFKGKKGYEYDGVCAFCVEPQYSPNAIRTGEQPSPLLKAGEEYHHYVSYTFSK